MRSSKITHTLARLSRIPERCRRDVRLIGMLENWPAALAAELKRTPLNKVEFRNGVRLQGPDTIDLAFLFHETWVREVYSFPGYEIRQGDVVIDVGANIGVFAAYAATRAPQVRVYAYEPFPENVVWLRKNIAASGLANVEVHQQAVADKTEQRYLRVHPSDWIMHSLFASEAEVKQSLAVECVGFDEVVDRTAEGRCDLLKLDCEGSEYDILQKCAPDTLRRVKRIVGEYHEGPHLQGTGKDLCRFLESRGFRIDRFEPFSDGCGVIGALNMAAAH